MYAVFAHVAVEMTFATVSHLVKTLLVAGSLVAASPAAFVLPVAHAVTVPAVNLSAEIAEMK
jgi:hypothetical protein